MEHRLTTFADLAVGQRASLSKRITDEDLAHFIAITGDVNPLHVDDDFARRTFFGERVVHGMLSASLFSTLVGMHLPGVGAIYRSQSLEFVRPVHVGDTLTAVFEVRSMDPGKNRIELASWIANQRGEVVVQGTAVVGLVRGLRPGGSRAERERG